MIQLLLTSIEMNELAKLLDTEPRYIGLYYYKQRPLEMYELNDLTVAVLYFNEENSETINVINYAELSIPAWKKSVPDYVKHVSKRRLVRVNGAATELANNVA